MRFFAWSLLFFTVAGCSGGEDASRDYTSIEAVLREGDLVFRRGSGITSRAVLTADKGGTYSHTGIVVRMPDAQGQNDGKWRVVHIVPGERDADGVKDLIKVEALESFFAPDRALEGAVMRVEDEVCGGSTENGVGDLCPAKRPTAARAAQRALALAATGLKFDHKYDLSDTTKMYCTELIHHVFAREGVDITDGRRSAVNAPGFSGDYILPTDIQHNPRVRAIYRF